MEIRRNSEGNMMNVKISLSESDLARIQTVLGIKEYDDIHESIVKAYGDMLDEKEGIIKKICPICGEKYRELLAISRRDGSSICDECGIREAMEEAKLPEVCQKDIIEAFRNGKKYLAECRS